jgi:hypothetical protein
MAVSHRKLIREHRLQIRGIAGHQHDISSRILKAKVSVQQLAKRYSSEFILAANPPFS